MNIATVQIQDAFCQGQPQTSPFMGVGFIALIELFKYSRYSFIAHTHTLIANLNYYSAGCLVQSDAYFSINIRKFNCII